MDFAKFSEDPFKFVDQLNLSVKGCNLNLFQKYGRIQKTALWGAMFCLAAWIVFGFDSTPLQFIHLLYDGVPAALSGAQVDWLGIYNLYYGKEMHYSAFVIYFLLFYALSKSWEKAGITHSKNMVFSFAGMFLAIALFEWFWILSFAHFQNQPWVASWRMPQLRILIQNTGFTVAGGLTCLYMLTERWHWPGGIQGERAYFFQAGSWKLWLSVGISIAAALFWIYYPGTVQLLTVKLENGQLWQSSKLFPQTLYTVDLNPGDGVNAGVWFWIQDDLIHAVNTGVKVLWALSIYMLFRVRGAE